MDRLKIDGTKYTPEIDLDTIGGAGGCSSGEILRKTPRVLRARLHLARRLPRDGPGPGGPRAEPRLPQHQLPQVPARHPRGV